MIDLTSEADKSLIYSDYLYEVCSRSSYEKFFNNKKIYKTLKYFLANNKIKEFFYYTTQLDSQHLNAIFIMALEESNFNFINFHFRFDRHRTDSYLGWVFDRLYTIKNDREINIDKQLNYMLLFIQTLGNRNEIKKINEYFTRALCKKDFKTAQIFADKFYAIDSTSIYSIHQSFDYRKREQNVSDELAQFVKDNFFKWYFPEELLSDEY